MYIYLTWLDFKDSFCFFLTDFKDSACANIKKTLWDKCVRCNDLLWQCHLKNDCPRLKTHSLHLLQTIITGRNGYIYIHIHHYWKEVPNFGFAPLYAKILSRDLQINISKTQNQKHNKTKKKKYHKMCISINIYLF